MGLPVPTLLCPTNPGGAVVCQFYQRTLQNVLRNEVVAIGIPHNFEPDFLADGPHGDVIGENVGGGGKRVRRVPSWGVGELLFTNQVVRFGG